MMEYRDFLARVEFDPDDRLFVGHLVGVNDIVGFHADNVEDLEVAFHEAVDDYLAMCSKVGKAPDKPYSGMISLRIAPELHRRVATRAATAGKSVNQFIAERLEEPLDYRMTITAVLAAAAKHRLPIPVQGFVTTAPRGKKDNITKLRSGGDPA